MFRRQRGTAEPEAQVAAAKHTPVETWESLNSKLESVREGIASIEEKIAEQSAAESNASSAPKTDTAGDEDELDVFMKANDILYVSDTVKVFPCC